MSIADQLAFLPVSLPDSTEELRYQVRAFLAEELRDYSALERSYSWDGTDPEFSRKLANKGWLGLTLPVEYGGQGLTNLERYVLSEELLFAGAPVGFHWIAERQSGPLIARIGNKAQKQAILPGICRGEISFCIGMSEPNAGSDLASLNSKAEKLSDGWRLNGTKLWTTNAHIADYMIGLFRTNTKAEPQHAGLSQFLIDLKNTAGISITPITDLTGRNHFNEVVFEDTVLTHDALLGVENEGWQQANAELSLERSGPERFLSCMVLFTELLDTVDRKADGGIQRQIGSILAKLMTLRAMSLSVAGMLARDEDASLQAVMVKELGAEFEQGMPSLIQDIVCVDPDLNEGAQELSQVLANLLMLAPSFSLRGGTVEILRGIIAKRIAA